MNDATITIKDKNFKLKFGLKFFRLLGEFLNLPTMMTVQQKVVDTLSDMGEDLSFEQIDVIEFMIMSAVQANIENTEMVTKDELDDLLLEDLPGFLSIVQVIMSEFVKSMPKPVEPEASGKIPAPKTGAKNK